jgi:hypothetical protein
MNWSIPERESGNGSLLVLSNFVYLAIFKTPENQLNPTGQKIRGKRRSRWLAAYA